MAEADVEVLKGGLASGLKRLPRLSAPEPLPVRNEHLMSPVDSACASSWCCGIPGNWHRSGGVRPRLAWWFFGAFADR